jgi:hypothetical protein
MAPFSTGYLDVPDYGELDLEGPEILVWVAIASAFCSWFPASPPKYWAERVGLDDHLLFPGIAIVAFFFRKADPEGRAAHFVQPDLHSATVMLAVIGGFDTWFNFRQLKTVAPTEAE